MDAEMIKWISGLGVGGVLAGVIFAAYRKDMRAFAEQWKGQTEVLISVVRDNTAAFTRNTEVVQSLHAHMMRGERRSAERDHDR